MTDSRTWLVTATIPFPTNVTSAIPPEVGDQLQVESRLEPKAFHVEGRKFLFQRGADWPEALGIDFRLEPAEIVTAVNAGDANAALADVESELEIVVPARIRALRQRRFAGPGTQMSGTAPTIISKHPREY